MLPGRQSYQGETHESSLAARPSFSHFFKGFLCVNDSSPSRTSRLRKVLRSYVPKQHLTDERIRITTLDGTSWGEVERNVFDRVNLLSFCTECEAFLPEENLMSSSLLCVQVLVDVPCTTDRHSVLEDDNNIFSKSRTGERRRLPQLQLQLLL